MVNGKEAFVEEFVLHRIGAEGEPSVFSEVSSYIPAICSAPEQSAAGAAWSLIDI